MSDDMIVNGINFNIGYKDIEAMPNGPEKAIQYAVCGSLTDGAHHKQWCCEEVLKALGVNLRGS